MFTRLPFLLAASLGVMVCATQADPVEDLIGIELQKRHLVGISVAVVHQGKVVKTAAAGLADLELGAVASPKTVFQIQSITKTFTATAVLLLVDEGKLNLDDPVSKHLEGTPESWRDITLRHLLSHTSGIKDFIREPTASLRIEVSEEDVLRATAGRPLNFAPGERYAYSNTNYHLLAMILRKLTGKSYGEVLRERLFAPLGMSDTRIVSHSDIIPGRASGYVWTGTGFRKGGFIAESILSYGGGGILSTAPDLALWALAMMESKVLKAGTLADAWTPARLNDGKSAVYGLGWGIGNVEGHRELLHTGGHVTGFNSCLLLYPDDGLAIVVLLNSRGPGLLIARRLAGLYIPALAPQPAKPIEDSEPETAALLRDLIGRIPDWRLEEARFSPELWKRLTAQREKMQAKFPSMGALRSLELLFRSPPDKLRTSRYRAVFAHQQGVFTLTLDPDRVVVGLFFQEEDY